MDDSFRQPDIFLHDPRIVRCGNQQDFPDLVGHQFMEDLKPRIKIFDKMIDNQGHNCLPRCYALCGLYFEREHLFPITKDAGYRIPAKILKPWFQRGTPCKRVLPVRRCAPKLEHGSEKELEKDRISNKEYPMSKEGIAVTLAFYYKQIGFIPSLLDIRY